MSGTSVPDLLAVVLTQLHSIFRQQRLKLRANLRLAMAQYRQNAGVSHESVSDLTTPQLRQPAA